MARHFKALVEPNWILVGRYYRLCIDADGAAHPLLPGDTGVTETRVHRTTCRNCFVNCFGAPHLQFPNWGLHDASCIWPSIFAAPWECRRGRNSRMWLDKKAKQEAAPCNANATGTLTFWGNAWFQKRCRWTRVEQKYLNWNRIGIRMGHKFVQGMDLTNFNSLSKSWEE